MTSTVTEAVRECVTRVPVGGFLHTSDVVESVASHATRSAVDVALHRLRDEAALVKIRPGLYYRGKPTRFGPTHPDPYSAGVEVAATSGFADGVGPAGFSAARAFGLTTQVPAFTEICVPGRPPAAFFGVRFARRSPSSRRGLRGLEVATLEVLRDWRMLSEVPWSTFVDRVAGAVDRGDVRIESLRKAAHRERHAELHKMADRLLNDLAERRSSPADAS